jgi:hypothetical protein
MKLSCPSLGNRLQRLSLGVVLFGILGLVSVRAQILLQSPSDPLTVYIPSSGSQTYDILGNITYDVYQNYDGYFGTSVQVGGYTYISGYTGFFDNIPVYSYYPEYETFDTYEYNGAVLNSISSTNAYDANGDELAVTYVGPNANSLYGSGSTGLIDLGQFTINSNTPLGTYEFSGPNQTGNSEFTESGYTYFEETGYYNEDSQTGLIANKALFSVVVAPEPSTYALMLGGLVFLGFFLRRKAARLG